MIRLLPFILIPVLLVGGLWYWRSSASQNLANPQTNTSQTEEAGTPIEVPKTLPGATTEQRVQELEDTVTQLVSQVNKAKPASSQAPGSLEVRLGDVEAAITDLKARVAALEDAPTTTTASTVSSSKYPLYIPLGSSSGPWGDQGWNSLTEYQAIINPDNYSGYSSMQLEVNFRLSETAGTASVRLYNVTDGSAVSNSQLDTTVTNFAVQASSTFKLPSGQKTYTIQVQTTLGRPLFIQSARIKVNF